MAWTCPSDLWHPLSMKGSETKHFPRCSGEHIREHVYLYPGEYHFATEPTLIHTVLGSCVSVILFDPKNRYGAMCHAILDSNPRKQDNVECSKYMDCVIDEMFGRFALYRVSLQNLVVKIFGGAQMLDHGGSVSSASQPGARNIVMARKMLQEYGCRIEAEDCGGFQGRKVYFCSHTGDVFLKRIKKSDDFEPRTSL